MKTVFAGMIVLAMCFTVMWTVKGYAAKSDEAQIRELLDHWAKAFRAHDRNGIMSIYESGNALVAYDLVGPLQFSGSDAYQKDNREFLDQLQGPIDVEMRDLSIATGGSTAFSHGLERISGTMKNGEKLEVWVRFTECYRKSNGQWLAVHDHISVPAGFATGKAALDLKP